MIKNQKTKKNINTIYIFWEALKMIVSLSSVILIIWVFLQFKTMYDKSQTILQLHGVIKNLKSNYPIADIILEEKQNGTNSILINFYNASGEIIENRQKILLTGENIYLDCTVYNFTYSLIETGKAHNIAVPERIYSNTIPPDSGIPLENKDKNGIPYTIIESNNFGNQEFHDLKQKRLKKLVNVIESPEQSKTFGIIRSTQRAAVANTNTLLPNKSYTVMVENSSGITLKRK